MLQSGIACDYHNENHQSLRIALLQLPGVFAVFLPDTIYTKRSQKSNAEGLLSGYFSITHLVISPTFTKK